MKNFYYLLIGLLIASCSDKVTNENVSTNLLSQTQNLIINHIPIKSTPKQSLEYVNDEYSFSRSYITDSEFDDVFKSFELNESVEYNNAFSIALFSNAPQNNLISSDIINAISIYHIEDGKAVQNFYTKKDEVFEIQMKASAGGVFVSSLNYLLFHKSNIVGSKRVSVLFNNKIDFNSINWDYETIGEIGKTVTNNLMFKSQEILTRIPDCSPCPPDNGDCSAFSNLCGGTFGDDGICDDNELRNHYRINNNGPSPEVIDEGHDLDLHTDFRDNFLMNGSANRFKYIEYYYLISSKTDSDFTVPLSTKIATTYLLYNLNDNITKLMQPFGYENEIFINDEEAAGVSSLIQKYKQLSTSLEWTNTWNDMESDLQAYTNKTNQFIRTNF